MIRGWIAFLKGLKRAPEDSGGFRIWVGLNVTVALLATAAQLEWPEFIWPCIALTLFGMWVSHRLRYRNNWEIKAALSILMFLALGNFFYGLSRSYYDPREPLAELLMWLQALHSCDLPTRKDLSYSLLSGLILMSVAAVLSVEFSFVVFLVLYYVTAIVSLNWSTRSLIAERTGWRPSRVATVSWSGSLGLGFRVLALGAVVVALMPRLEGFRIRALPVSWESRLQHPTVSQGEVQNPYYPSQLSPEQMRRNSAFNPDGYAGFNTLVDLQMRGRLSAERVFQARTNIPCYFRGLTFDHYDGQFWTQEQTTLRTRTVVNPPFNFRPAAYNPVDVVQIFYVDRPLPNLVLFCPDAYQVFFPSQTLYEDVAGCLRAPFTLDKGMVYSVVSRQSRMDSERIRRLPRRDPEMKQMAHYRQLPAGLPGRVRRLAQQITADKKNHFDAVVALSQHLQTHYRYNLDVPRYPEGQDVVDHFLFDAKEGYCEHFASAMVVFCRSVGLPARYATGYLPGQLNPFSGFREVFGNDAHAWAEVYLPGYGWMTIDPTPGGNALPEVHSEPKAEERWLGLAMLKYLSDRLEGRWQGLSWWLAGIGVSFLLLAARQAWLRRGPEVDPIVSCLVQAMALLGPPAAGCSPRQWARGIAFPEVHQLVELHESVAYAGRPSRTEERVQARLLLKRLRQALPPG